MRLWSQATALPCGLPHTIIWPQGVSEAGALPSSFRLGVQLAPPHNGRRPDRGPDALLMSWWGEGSWP